MTITVVVIATTPATVIAIHLLIMTNMIAQCMESTAEVAEQAQEV